MASKTYQIDNPTAVIGELAKQLQKKYGNEALAIFTPILIEYGFHSGTRLAKKLAGKDFPARVEAWLEPLIKAGLSEVVEKSPSRVSIRGTACPLNLENTNAAICEACMRIDEGLVSALAERPVTVQIEQSMARGDARCSVVFLA